MNRIKKDVNYLQNLIDYGKKNMQKGYSLDSLRWALINQGHSRIEVEKALATAKAEIEKESVVSKPRMEPILPPQMPEVEPEKKPIWKRFFG